MHGNHVVQQCGLFVYLGPADPNPESNSRWQIAFSRHMAQTDSQPSVAGNFEGEAISGSRGRQYRQPAIAPGGLILRPMIRFDGALGVHADPPHAHLAQGNKHFRYLGFVGWCLFPLAWPLDFRGIHSIEKANRLNPFCSRARSSWSRLRGCLEARLSVAGQQNEERCGQPDPLHLHHTETIIRPKISSRSSEWNSLLAQ
jgi:hypothetical protein